MKKLYTQQKLIPDSFYSNQKADKNYICSQQHFSDYYAITDRPLKKSKTKKQQIKKKRKKIKSKSIRCLTIGHAENHSMSLQKLQFTINTLGKRKIEQVQQNQKIENQNKLLLRQILQPKNIAQEDYIKQLEQKTKRLQQLQWLLERQDKLLAQQANRLNKKLGKHLKQIKSLEKIHQQNQKKRKKPCRQSHKSDAKKNKK